MTLTDYVARIREYVPASLSLPLESLYNAINVARRDVARIYDFNVLTQNCTGNGTVQLFNLPGAERVYRVSGTANNSTYLLREVNPKDFVMGGTAGNSTYYWFPQGMQQIGFYPIPANDTTISVMYAQEVADLTEASPTETIPPMFIDIVEYLASSEVAMKVGSAALAQMYLQIADRKRAQIPRMDITSELPSPAPETGRRGK